MIIFSKTQYSARTGLSNNFPFAVYSYMHKCQETPSGPLRIPVFITAHVCNVLAQIDLNLYCRTEWRLRWLHPHSGPNMEPIRRDRAMRFRILIDGQTAYGEIAAAFHGAKQFIYLTLSYASQDFLLVPESNETMFDILMSRRKEGVDVRMVVWQPASDTPDTIPDPSPAAIAGVNEGQGSIQARWDKAKGYSGWYRSPDGHFEPFYLDFPAQLGCHHQKTYIMDDGAGGVVAFVGGINPVQAYWDTPAHDSSGCSTRGARQRPAQRDLRRRPRSMTFFTGSRARQLAMFLLISSNVIMARAFPIKT